MSAMKRWRRCDPDCDGLWLWREFGHEPVRILVIRGEVASDDDWAQEMGREPDEVYSENYWEGPNIPDMTKYGHWMFDTPLKERGPK
jgi:hypothetical protein